MRTLSIVMPAYNERENVESAIDGATLFLQKKSIKGEIVIVDDGSRDGTTAVLRKIKKRIANLRVVTHRQNTGYGDAVWDGLRAAKGDLIFFTDSDCQFDINQLSLFLRKIESSDVVIGFRKKRSEGWRRKINALGWGLVCRIMLGIKFKDIDCAFKLFRRGALKNIQIISSGAAFSAELLYRLKESGCKISEIPVKHYKRTHGRPTGAKASVIVRSFKEIWLLRQLVRR